MKFATKPLKQPRSQSARNVLNIVQSSLYNVAYLFDNDLTVIYALMSLWAAVFMEMWKRRQSVMVWEWDLEMDEQEEQTRPEFEVLD